MESIKFQFVAFFFIFGPKMGNLWFFHYISSTSFANFLKKNSKIFNIAKLKKKILMERIVLVLDCIWILAIVGFY
jgi:hypothetical protein